jgi:hypothetical protein
LATRFIDIKGEMLKGSGGGLREMAKSVSQMGREPTEEEREKIVRAIVAGDRIGATSMYISITECGLTDAQEFIKARTTELQAKNPEKLAQKQQKRHRF